ncbi:MAG: hypothetical protein IT458_00970 [Planctomycetes bacterium]|nr:hypothetical protein [Planctomycetota bacterium]
MRLLVLGLLVLPACREDPEPPDPGEATSAAPATQPALADGRMLEAAFPGPTHSRTNPVQTPYGTLEQHTQMFQDEHGAFGVQWTEFPSERVARSSREAIYEQSVRGAAAATGAQVREQRRVDLGGVEGREVLVDDGRDHAYRARFFLVGNRLHHATVATTPARMAEPRVQSFFDSLRLVPRKP